MNMEAKIITPALAESLSVLSPAIFPQNTDIKRS